QLWWIPVSDATTAELEALDLASWFQIRMSLTEIAPEVRSQLSAEMREVSAGRDTGEPLKELEGAVARQRRLVQADEQSYSSGLVTALNNLADRYRNVKRLKEAESALEEALSIARRLAGDNSNTHLAGVGRTLNNLANLYRATQRM